MSEGKPAIPVALKRTVIILVGAVAMVGVALTQTPFVKAAFATKSVPPQAVRTQSAPSADLPFVRSVIAGADQAAALHRLIAGRAEHIVLRTHAEQVPPAGSGLVERLRRAHADVAAEASSQLLPADGAPLAQLGGLRGIAFDRAAMDREVQQRQHLLDLVEREAHHGRNPELRAAAQEALPAMRRQLDRAHQTAAQLARVGGPAPRVAQRPPVATSSAPVAAIDASPAATPVSAPAPGATLDLNQRELLRIEREARRR